MASLYSELQGILCKQAGSKLSMYHGNQATEPQPITAAENLSANPDHQTMPVMTNGRGLI